MIVLLIKSDLIRSQPLGGHSCPNCGKTDGLQMELRQRYAEFATMSINPKGVFGVVHCQHCGYTLPASRWTDDLHRAFVSAKTGYKTPRRYWVGLIGVGFGIVAFVAIFGAWAGIRGEQQRADNAHREALFASATQHPTPGVMLVTITNGDPTYTVWRVSRVTAQAVWLKRYAGSRQLTDLYGDKTWGTVPDSEFGADAVAYSTADLAKDRGLRRTNDVSSRANPSDALVIAVLE